jgi:hypothetical protein
MHRALIARALMPLVPSWLIECAALTRRRSTDARREGWHIYCGDD